MFIDTSAIIAILGREAEALSLRSRIEQASVRLTSPLVRLETCMVLSSRLRVEPVITETLFDAFVAEADIQVVPITDAIARIAVEAFQRFGKGRGTAAQLNLADCMSYACARLEDVPILYKGRDFSHTDLRSA